MSAYTTLLVIGVMAVCLTGYLPLQITSKALSVVTSMFISTVALTATFIITKNWLDKEHEAKTAAMLKKYDRKIKRLKKEQDTSTLEKTIRDGTKTLIKNALDYFKIENIKNEMGATAAIQNLQLDKYGQIIELLAEFSLILPDYQENRQIVQEEIDHQIAIYEIDEIPFALFMQRILEKYSVTVDKKIREKEDMNKLISMKTCPRCAERVLLKAKICKHCAYEFKTVSKTPVHNTVALDRVEKGRALFNSGKYNEALDVLNGAIDLKPNHAKAYYNRAMVYNKIGRIKDAENDLKEASYLGDKRAQELLTQRGVG